MDVFIGGLGYAAERWISGTPCDLLHGAGNFVIALVLFVPLRRQMNRLYKSMRNNHH